VIENEWAETLWSLAGRARCLPTDLLASRSLPELLANATLLRAAEAEKRNRVHSLIRGKNALDAIPVLLELIARDL
jgi:hypothetical protein